VAKLKKLTLDVKVKGEEAKVNVKGEEAKVNVKVREEVSISVKLIILYNYNNG